MNQQQHRHLTTTTPTTTNSANPSSSSMTEDGQGDEEEDEIYDEIEIEDMSFDDGQKIYHYPCPCGDRFEISVVDLRQGKDVATCPGCSLRIRVVFDLEDLT